LNQLTPLTLAAEELEASARVDPAPENAVVAIDGVSVGRGVWEGRLRAGGHKIEVAAEGFLPSTRQVSLEKGERRVVALSLERDPTSRLWAVAHPPKVVVEATIAMFIAPVFGGDIRGTCGAGCSSTVPFGGHAALRGEYQLSSGLGFGVDIGYLLLGSRTSGRATNVYPLARPVNPGVADDDVRLSGLTAGMHAGFHWGDAWPITLRVGAGVLLGSGRDERNGTFTNSLGQRYSTALRETTTATYLYVGPEARVGRRLGDHLEVGFGVELMMLAAITTPSWRDANPVLATPDPLASQGDGGGGFGAQSMAGSLLFVVEPSLSVRYDF
jgi:hypothetical protein